MNNFKLMTMAALAALSLASCQKQEPVYTVQKKVTITKSDVLFNVYGGTGSIEFQSTGTATVSCKSEWCAVSLSGNKVTVIAPEYKGLEGRSAAINIACDKDTVRVTAQQYGMVFTYKGGKIDFPMAGGLEHIYGTSSYEETIEADPWITCFKVTSGYGVEVAENTSGDDRTGTIKISSGSASATYVIHQTFERNFSGTYTVSYGGAVKGDVTLERSTADDNAYYLKGLIPDSSIPLTYDPSSRLLYIKNCQYIKQHTDGNYIYAIVNFAKASSNYVSYSTTAAYDIFFSFTYNEGKYTIDLYDSAKAISSSYTSTGMTLYTFSVPPGTTLSSSNRVATVLACKKIGFVQK